MGLLKQGGAEEAREAHNLNVGGSKPPPAICPPTRGLIFGTQSKRTATSQPF